MLVIGDKEVESGELAVRSRANGDLGSMSVDGFLAMMKEKIDSYAID